jgi:putative tryptophan/tyrosine transport system substrate-binding protein
MKRRTFIMLLGGAAAAWPLAAHAQQAMPVIGFLYSGSLAPIANSVAAFRKGLSEMGYTEGQNVAFEFRSAENDNARLPELAAELVRRQVTVIATPGSPAAAGAAKAATTTIPVVFGTGLDHPVQAGLVASLRRPGGNVTGVSTMNAELWGKRLGLLLELVPGARRVAMLVNLNSPTTAAIIADVQAVAASLGRQVEIVEANTSREIDAAIASSVQKQADALLVGTGPPFAQRRVQLATLTARHAVPAMFSDRQYVEAGGLMSYGSNVTDMYRQVGIYTGRILKGEKPAELPVLQAAKFELVVNLHTAGLLGLEIPPTVLARADEVIE